MSNTLLKGETSTVKVRFLPSIVTVAPTWVLYDWNGDEILTGTATADALSQWAATFTIPKTMPIPSGEQELSVEFTSVDTRNRDVVRSKSIFVLDTTDSWQSVGLLYHTADPEIEDIAIFEAEPTSIVLSLREGYGAGTELFTATLITPTFDSFTSSGYAYKVNLPVTGIVDQSGGMYPYQLFVKATFANGSSDSYMKPVYVLTPLIGTHVNSMRRYLDKARINELDQNLQFQDDELVHFLLEGVQYLNGIKDLTYWTVPTLPTSLNTYLIQAASWTALNARFLAEGMNSFEFQGANTQLTFNRREAIQTKMDELRSVLDTNFPPAKTSAIRTSGIGVPPPAAVASGATTSRRVGALGIGLSPNTNRTGHTYGKGGVTNGYRF